MSDERPAAAAPAGRPLCEALQRDRDWDPCEQPATARDDRGWRICAAHADEARRMGLGVTPLEARS